MVEGSLRMMLLLGFGDLLDRPDKGDEPAVIVDVFVADIFKYFSLPTAIGLEELEDATGAKDFVAQDEGRMGQCAQRIKRQGRSRRQRHEN
jgi:hypothetical protein